MAAGSYALNELDKHLVRAGWSRVVLEGRQFSKSAVAIVLPLRSLRMHKGPMQFYGTLGLSQKNSHAMLCFM